MNKTILLIVAAVLISITLHIGIMFLSFNLEDPEEINSIIPVFEMVDAIIVDEPEIIEQPPEPEIEPIEEINDAVIPEEEQLPPEPLPKPEPQPEPEKITENQNTSATSTSFTKTTNYIPFYRVEKRPEFSFKAELKYPLQAKRNKLEGTVIIEADIDEGGILQQIKIVKSAGFGFDESAVEMLENSSFKPAVMDGRAVGVRMRFTIKFEL